MPMPTGASLPEDKSFPIIPADVYGVSVLDIESETKPSMFKNPDGSAQEDRTQYKIKFGILDAGEYLDSWLSCWVNPSLRASTKSKRPTLPQLLLAITGQTFGPDDREKVTGAFLNTLIGSKLRVATQVEQSKTTGKSYAVVTSFLPVKTGKEKKMTQADPVDIPFV